MFSDRSESVPQNRLSCKKKLSLNNALPCFKDYKGQQFSKGINGTLKKMEKTSRDCTIITFSLVR